MATYNVTNATQLQSALASAVGGDRVILAAGDYGDVRITNRNYASNVTLQTQSFQDKAHFDGLFIQNSKNLTIVGMDIGRALDAGEPEYTQLSWVRDSSNIKLSRVDFHGSLDDNPSNDGVGLQLTNVTGFNVNNSTFEELYRGVAIQKSANVTFQSNLFETLRSDGIVVASTDGIVVDKNRFQDFRPILPDHADFIQFWNTGQTKGSSNITIKNNVMMQEYFSGVDQTGVQGIFISDPLSYGYKNVLIQNNMLWSNDAYNGVTVNGGTNVQILGNSVLSKSNDAKQFWIRLEGGSNLYVKNNVTDNIMTKDVTRFYQDNNVNFAVTPGSRALFPMLNAPDGESDLILSGVGFQQPSQPVGAPVSTAVGSSIGSMLSGAVGASLTKTTVDAVSTGGSSLLSASGMLDTTSLHSATVAVTPVADLPSLAQIFAPIEPVAAAGHWAAPAAFVPMLAAYDHFTALP